MKLYIQRDGSLSSYENTEYMEEVVIPKFVHGQKVTCIDRFAFREANVKKIVIPKSVTKIRDDAFKGCLAEEIIFEDDSELETIGDYAFLNNVNLRNIKFTTKKKLILGRNIFEGAKSLKSLDLSGCNIEEIPSKLCPNSVLEKIKLPKTVIELNEYAFSESSISDISFLLELPLLRHISWGCFQDTNVEHVSEEILSRFTIAPWGFKGTKLKEITIPKNGNCLVGAFSDCHYLKKATVNCETVASQLFSGCEALETVTLNDVKTINSGAFENCGLTNVILTQPAKLETISVKAFMNNKLTQIDLSNTSIDSIPLDCFCGNNLSDVKLPYCISSIWPGAFRGNKINRYPECFYDAYPFLER